MTEKKASELKPGDKILYTGGAVAEWLTVTSWAQIGGVVTIYTDEEQTITVMGGAVLAVKEG